MTYNTVVVTDISVSTNINLFPLGSLMLFSNVPVLKLIFTVFWSFCKSLPQAKLLSLYIKSKRVLGNIFSPKSVRGGQK